MVNDDNSEAFRHLYGGVARMQANIATSQAAYAEATKRMAGHPSIAVAIAQAVEGKPASIISTIGDDPT
jgi:hypothetical protein